MDTFSHSSHHDIQQGVECTQPEQVIYLVEETLDEPIGLITNQTNSTPQTRSPAELLNDLVETLDEIKNLRTAAFRVDHQQNEYGECFPLIDATPEVMHLVDYPCTTVHAWIAESNLSMIHPYVVEYLRFFGDTDLAGLFYHGECSWEQANQVVEFLNWRLNSLKSEIKSYRVQRHIERQNDPRRHRPANLRKYIDGLFHHYSRLLVVRVDLGYHAGLALNPVLALPVVTISSVQDLPQLQSPLPQRHSFIDYESIRQHRFALLDFIRDHFRKNFCGYIWKLEYGPQKGYHYHLMLFFNGAHLRKDVMIGKSIGEHWNTVVTGGRGVYHNCNADKDRYHYCGLGMVPWHSAEQMTGVEMASGYLAKPDFVVRQDMPRYQRIIGTGRLPKPREENTPRRGRPRQQR